MMEQFFFFFSEMLIFQMKHYMNSSFTAISTKNLVEMISMKFHIIRIKAYGQNEVLCFIRIKCFNKAMMISFCQNFNSVDNVDVWTVNCDLVKRDISKQVKFWGEERFQFSVMIGLLS